jgi:hypothetical protein
MEKSKKVPRKKTPAKTKLVRDLPVQSKPGEHRGRFDQLLDDTIFGVPTIKKK